MIIIILIKQEGGLITATKNDTNNTLTNRRTIIRKQKWEENQLYGSFKRLINVILHEKTWTCLRKENFKRETESRIIAAQNNAIRTNEINARIDKTQQNNKCRLCGNRVETINLISECSILAQREYKTRHDLVGKKFKFDYTNKRHMHNPAAGLENDTHKLLRDFDIQMDHLILARRPDLVVIDKKKKKRELEKL